MKPQPPEETIKVQHIAGTDSFDCLGFGKIPPSYETLATVHRPIGSTIQPIWMTGKWYWKTRKENDEQNE